MARETVISGPPTTFGEGELCGLGLPTRAGGPPAYHLPSHRLSPGAQAHTPSWGSKWSLPGGWPCCSNKAGGAAAWGRWGEQMPLVARGSRALAERSRKGGAGEASRSRSPSSS